MKNTKQFLKQQMQEYLRTIPDVSHAELAELAVWVAGGNSPYSNPYYLADEQGREMPFILALRVVQELNDSLGSDLF